MRLLRSATARLLAAALAGLLLGACSGTLYDAAGVPPPPAASTCDTGLHLCGAVCVEQSPAACGDACTDCTLLAIDPNATHSCEPGAAGTYACGQVCNAGWLACSTGCCRATAVAAGDDHACAVTSDGGLLCWGKNDLGQLGPGAAGLARSVRPVVVPLSGVTAVAAGGRHTCAVLGSGATATVSCWGANESGQLGNGTPSATAGIVSAGLTGATALALGASHSCAVVGSGAAAAVWCWGANGAGQLGLGTVDAAPHASPAASLVTASTTALSAAGDDTCAIVAGVATCWGLDLEGQTGSGSMAASRPTPVSVPLPIASQPPAVKGPAISVAVGRKHACANYADAGGGTPLYCWGSGGEGELGNGLQGTPELVPVQAGVLDNNGRASILVAGEAFTCSAKAGELALVCNGRNNLGQCAVAPPATPVLDRSGPAFGRTVFAASAGRAFTCALVAQDLEKVVMCWGSNADGQLGRDTAPPASPPYLPGLVGG